MAVAKESTINTIAKAIEEDDQEHYGADLEQALTVAGIGWYNVKYCLALALFLIAAIIEPVGYAYVLPAAKCDLNMTDAQRGFIGSIPYIGVVITSFPWGYLIDTRGRKWVVIYSSIAVFVFGVAAAFMPDLISFTMMKLLTALCLACPAATPYTYIGEIVPQKYRDITLSITNALQILGATFVPLLAWAILPMDFRIDFGLYEYRPWRVLCIIYISMFLIGALLLLNAPESPKYLLAQGRHEEALETLKMIYAANNKKSPEEYPIKMLKVEHNDQNQAGFFQSLKQQSMPILTPPYLKWFMLNSTMFFGLFAILNGLYMWVPDILNRVISGTTGEDTACQIIGLRFVASNETNQRTLICEDTMDTTIFLVNSGANIACAVLAILVSATVNIVGKKNLLIAVFCIIGFFIILVNFITQGIVFAVLLSAIPILGLGIGPINAYNVEIFPTSVRGMAVCLSMMLGRLGSVVGTNVAGILLNAACEATFYCFGGLLIFCAALALFLPKSANKLRKSSITELTKI